jgi:rubrerythrin
MAITSNEWWAQTKASPERIVEWLRQQFHGEVTAADRIEKYCASAAPEKWSKTLARIAADESRHAAWIGALLEARGVMPELQEKNERYWDAVSAVDKSFENVTAIASHAEAMRLERIRVIASDESAPEDIRLTFEKILRDEVFHMKAFREMAGASAMKSNATLAKSGRAALGLINAAEVM